MPVKSKTRVVTLAQLALLPVGTLLACVKFDKVQILVDWVDFDVQGVMQVSEPFYLGHVDDTWINLRPMLADIHISDGRVVPDFTPTSIARNSTFPHRFVIYEADGIYRRDK